MKRKSMKRKGSRKYKGGSAPVNYSNPGPMNLNLAQGRQFDEYHKNQHGGEYGPYPGAVSEASLLPSDLVASAKLLPLNAAFAEIRGMTDQAGGKRRRRATKKAKKSRKSKKAKKSRKTRKAKKSRKSRKSRKGSRKQRGGLYRWGGGARRYKGGAYAEMRYPMPVGDESKMLIPSSLQAQAGLNPEWKLAENPMSFAPKM
jgi:hypothetical protein